MKKSIAMKWIKILRNGEFKQIKGALENESGNCCLGVLCNMALIEGICDFTRINVETINAFDNAWVTLPCSVMKWAEIKTTDASFNFESLADINDQGKSFSQIADIIEKHWR